MAAVTSLFGRALRSARAVPLRPVRHASKAAVYTSQMPMIDPDSYPAIPTFRVLGLDGTLNAPADMPKVGLYPPARPRVGGGPR